MKKIFAWICAITGIVLLVSSSSKSVMLKVWEWNRVHLLANTSWYGKFNNQWGDLAKMSLLDGIDKFKEPVTYNFIKPVDDGNKNIDLYLYGDSYTADIPDYAFANISSFYHGINTTGLVYKLDSSRKNILILETTERFVMASLYNNEIFNILRKDDGRPVKISHGGDGRKSYALIVNKNLEYLIFNYNFINAMRRCKADMNYMLFNRASGDVSISENGRYLFLKPTIVPDGLLSCYTPVSDSTINELVTGFNKVYEHYKKEGFAEVYFSIIPNPATILQPKGYNNLIPRIRDNPLYKMPYFDVYDTFRKNNDPSMLYRLGDTHWNNNGMQIWLNIVNTELRKKSAQFAAGNAEKGKSE